MAEDVEPPLGRDFLALLGAPLKWKTDVRLPPAAEAARAVGLGALFRSKSGPDEFLPPDQAFRFGAGMVRPDSVALTWVIAEGYYLHRHRIEVSSDTPGVQLGTPLLPPGKPKHDEFFGDTEVYYEVLEASVPVARAAGSGGTLNLNVTYQGCAEGGLCYNPITTAVALELPPTDVATTLPADAAPGRIAPVAEQDRLATLIRDGNLAAVLATFFGIGILLSFTPCVLPMVPILSAVAVEQRQAITTI